MRAVVQRVNFASVTVDGKKVSQIKKGLLVFVGFSFDDKQSDLEYIFKKVINLRIFEDEIGKMNFSLLDKNFEVLVVSQFTLYGDCRKGNRPNFMNSLSSDKAVIMYEQFLKLFTDFGINIKSGIFQADMKVQLENDGPVTIQLDSNKMY
ncbi:MAG: D-aminoacyl-tRNA deacylase [Peptoniphilaceae bacterium]|uniref:D-aminoacyl-tRNA deacylase n=1 Tax=Parvimonas sp. TaxID=1944660 RepID=UPI0025CBD8D3|nr:D-aminoacyl-tRNA deacylase [Parvimonas sp.]MCI5997227.1 D-aminoacyl-tRNA deacylase [Parvimonas sp.]MDD7764377.1 D-aminoacyl-tRNA deacylase [Peptoniphilaceae bacterium]MDY3050037.1 D-aminoacyl-tRNA deacylase [Parvimonas sp.]